MTSIQIPDVAHCSGQGGANWPVHNWDHGKNPKTHLNGHTRPKNYRFLDSGLVYEDDVYNYLV
jgi:hypothetical protein